MSAAKYFIPQRIINIFYHLPKAFLANIIYGFPARKLKVIGITGTDGKTTTTNMVYKVLKDAGKKASMISTINAVIGGKIYDTGFHVTSPDPFTIQKMANLAYKSGDEFLVLEITSHALDQYRIWGINFEVAVITNITHEHLDYHKTFENYFDTKFRLVKKAKLSVINENIKGDRGYMDDRVVTFGLDNADFNQRDLRLSLKIPGDFNIENALACFAVCSKLGIGERVIKDSLENFSSLSGRMEEIKNNLGIKIIVDFAHTPNGLEQALKALRKICKGRLISVFGAAAKRDISKRPLMGEKAAMFSDFVVLTAEDPRGENVERICSEIARGILKKGKILNKDYFIINDRKKAIEYALNNLAKKGDTVVMFGKGHETSMNLDGINEVPWSDVEVVKKIIYER